MTKDEGRDMTQIVEQIRKKADEFGTDSAEFKKYCEKADENLKKLDVKNEETVKAAEESRKKELELVERVKHLEVVASNAGSGQSKELTVKSVNGFMNALLKNQWIGYVNENA